MLSFRRVDNDIFFDSLKTDSVFKIQTEIVAKTCITGKPSHNFEGFWFIIGGSIQNDWKNDEFYNMKITIRTLGPAFSSDYRPDRTVSPLGFLPNVFDQIKTVLLALPKENMDPTEHEPTTAFVERMNTRRLHDLHKVYWFFTYDTESCFNHEFDYKVYGDD